MRTREAVRARRWLWATLLPAAVLLGAAGWLAVQLGAVQVGVQRSHEGDYAGAARAFGVAQRVAAVERWVPAFDHGTAQYRLRLWDAAAGDFERAAGMAPTGPQCTIRLNWAWSLEAGADELLAAEDVPGAMVRLQQAQLVLSTAPCPGQLSPADDAGSPPGTLEDQWNDTRQRLEDKTDGTPPVEANPEDSPDPSESQLADRERQAQEQRQQVIDEGTNAESNEGQKTW